MKSLTIKHHNIEDATIAYAWSHEPVERPLVMLHGLGDSAIRTFSPRLLASPLAAYPRLYIDLPGFGESCYTPQHPATVTRYADDVASLLTVLGISRAPVFGHSMGGNVAIHLARSASLLVEGLIVAEPLLDAKQSILAADIARFSEVAFCEKRYPLLVRATSLQAHRGDIAVAGFLEPLQLTRPTAMYRAARSLIQLADASYETLVELRSTARAVLVGARTDVTTSDLETHEIEVIRVAEAGHNMLVEQEIHTSYAILDALNRLEMGNQQTQWI